MADIKQWVILCGESFDQQIADVYGTFDSETCAQDYLTDKHGVEGWRLATNGECFGGVTDGGHVIVEVFK